MRRLTGYFFKNMTQPVDKNIAKSKLLGSAVIASAIASGLIYTQRDKLGLIPQFADASAVAEDNSS